MIVKNANRPGYKNTKVGWIPKEWAAQTLNCISGFITKGATPTTYGFSWVPKETGIPFIRSECVSTSGIIETKLSYISMEAHHSLRRSEVKPGDILITITGHVGRVICFPSEIPLANINQHIARVRIDKQNTNKGYVFHYLSMKSSQTHFQRIVTGQAYPQISLKQVREKLIPLPPLPEQKKIAKILSTWDEAIEQTRKLIETKKRRKKALMQQLLTGKKRLPSYNSNWVKLQIGKVLEVVTRRVNFYDDTEYTLVSVRRRSQGLFLRSILYGREILTKNLYRIEPGDFLISKMQIVHGASALVTNEFGGMNVSGSYISLVPVKLNILDSEYLDWFSRTPEFYHLTLRSSYGVHIEKMTFNLNLFFKSHIYIPSEKYEQSDIADVLSIAETEIKTLENKLTALKNQKHGLMQKLLTGEVRVITKYILDTCIFNWLLNERISHDDLPKDAHFVITHLQIDEINKTNDEDLRARLQLILTRITHEVVHTENFVFGISRFDHAKLGKDSPYSRLVSELNKLSNRKSNNIRDALIAEVAIQNSYGLLTADRNLAKVARRNGCYVRFYTNTEKSER